MRNLTVIWILFVGLCTASLVVAAPPTSGANVAQVDRVSPWVCAASATSPVTFTDIPDLSVALTTQGGPVLMMLTLDAPTFWAGGGQSILFDPVIDGQPLSRDRLTVSSTNFWAWPFAFSRVYVLAAGTHTFSGRLACISQAADLARAWLTVYELPAVKR